MSIIALITNQPAIGIIANQIQLTQIMPNHRPLKEKTQPDFLGRAARPSFRRAAFGGGSGSRLIGSLDGIGSGRISLEA
jgi:hypothetical protein